MVKNMTYRELRDKLNTLSDEQLNQDVTVVDPYNEFIPIWGVKFAEADDVLDLGHPFLCQN